jgi:Rieske Fe-S protein
MINACSKEETAPPTTPTTPTTPALLTINLATQITAVGDYISDKGIIVVRTATGNVAASFIAFDNRCPHQGSPVSYVNSSKTFNCSAHGSNFNADGTLKNGPASTGLIKKSLQVTGTTLSVVS